MAARGVAVPGGENTWSVSAGISGQRYTSFFFLSTNFETCFDMDCRLSACRYGCSLLGQIVDVTGESAMVVCGTSFIPQRRVQRSLQGLGCQ